MTDPAIGRIATCQFSWLPSHVGGMRLLYITYDGLADPIGQSQILPYLQGCAERGHDICVISFEKPDRLSAKGKDVSAICANAGIEWLPQRFHHAPPFLSKAYDLWRMERAATDAVRQLGPFELVHARSYQAGWIGRKLKQQFGIPLLFDMRGYWADQRREGGRWPDSSLIGRNLYQQWKRREAAMVNVADHIVVLTEAARNDIMSWEAYGAAPVSVIPCCADFTLFGLADAAARRQTKLDLGFGPDDPVLGYLGSTGTVYRYDAHLRLFAKVRARDPRAKLLHVGPDTSDSIIALASRLGISIAQDELAVRHADRNALAPLLSAMDVATAFYTDSYYSKGVSPTKVGECLACGVSIIGNDAVGDTAALMHELSTGHSIPDFSDRSLNEACEQFFCLREKDRSAIRERAQTMFDLPLAVKGYSMIYDSLTPLRLPKGG